MFCLQAFTYLCLHTVHRTIPVDIWFDAPGIGWVRLHEGSTQ